MDDVHKILNKMKHNPNGIKFKELKKICEHFFGKPRISKSSHCIFKTPWVGDPRINIQNAKGMAKAYQVKQVLSAILKLEALHERKN